MKLVPTGNELKEILKGWFGTHNCSYNKCFKQHFWAFYDFQKAEKMVESIIILCWIQAWIIRGDWEKLNAMIRPILS